MVRNFLLLIAVVTNQALFSQHHDHHQPVADSTYGKQPHGSWNELIVNGEVIHHEGKVVPYATLRFVYEGNLSLDIRAMLPYRNTVTFGFGHTFKLKPNGCLTISPGIYLKAGEYLGISPGMFIRYSEKKWFVLHTQQMVFGFTKKSPHNYFTITTIDYRITRKIRCDIGGEFEAIVAVKPQQTISHSEESPLVPSREFLLGPQFRLWLRHDLYVEATFLQDLEKKFHQKAIISIAYEIPHRH